MSGADEFILVEVFLDGQVAVSGRSISPEGQQDAYTAAIAYIGNQAAQRGTRLLAKGIDHNQWRCELVLRGRTRRGLLGI